MKCDKCGRELPSGVTICSSCNSISEKGDVVDTTKVEKKFSWLAGMAAIQGNIPFTGATAYGIPSPKSTVVASSVISPLAATVYGIPSPSSGSAVGIAVLAARCIPTPKGAVTSVYGIPPISSRVTEKRNNDGVKDEKLCHQCKSKIKLDDKVCPKCGAKLGFTALLDFENE